MSKAVDPKPASVPFYIPHHAVFRESSTTTRLRVVFNASQKSTTGQSLNQYLAVGPKLQIDLVSVILRWRQFKYVCTADISKMYRQILIDPRDTDFQRILWRTSPSLPVNEYQLLTVTYGTTSAPFLALRVLNQLITDEGHAYPLAVPVLQQQTYVDDCLFGADAENLALETRKQLVSLLKRGGFHLHKWAANHDSLLRDIDPSEHAMVPLNLRIDENMKVLGISWNPDLDSFTFKFSPPTETVFTKRTMLSIIARLFDPLGWIAPIIISAKILIQHLWVANCGWDDELPSTILDEWNRFYNHLPMLTTLSLPRWTSYKPKDDRVELHGFADASMSAYAAVVYLRVIPPQGPITVSLLVAKSKVAPLKTISIPRLELCAAVLLIRLIDFTRRALNVPELKIFCWSDSTVTLEWISQSPARWKTFVANRVSKIHDFGRNVKWKHVPTHDNPADSASRGLTARDLQHHKLWWSGPSWLQSAESLWPTPPATLNSREHLEERTTVTVANCTINPSWDLQTKYSSWYKLIRVTALVIKFIDKLRHRSSDSSRAGFENCELLTAKHFWLRTIQRESFPQEQSLLSKQNSVSTTSHLAALSPYLDEIGLIRARGRLRNSNVRESAKHPIILKSHPLVKLMIADLHLRLFHGGPQLLLARLREEFWILRARPLIRSVLYQCIPCTRENARLTDQLMGDLPSCRVNPSVRPFIHTGVDYAGPILVRVASGRGHKAHKAYIALFVCMTTKALHLELVSNYTTDAFLAAYRRFISRRGTPTHMYSDNGTNFRGAERELHSSFLLATRDSTITHQSADEGTSWHYIPPAAPHFGGLWEAAVRSVKYHLRRCVGSHTLTFEEMNTLLCCVEACLNSRPLVALSDSIDDYQCLTPGHFLIGTALTSPAEPSTLTLSENRLSRWQVVQRIQENVWHAWKRDYLQTLQQRPKWRARQTLAKSGQLVLLKDSGLPPSQWTLGRITTCHPGNDGLVRVVTVKTASSEYKRPITKLCFLPIDINTVNEKDSSTVGGA